MVVSTVVIGVVTPAGPLARTSARALKTFSCIVAGLLLLVPSAAFAKDKTSTLTYTPAITLTLEVQTPAGTPRVYPTAAGPTYWTQDMPVAVGDHVKLDIFVATGGGELQQAKVRLDNKLIATLNSFPWNTQIDTSAIGAGGHFLEVWAQELEPDGKRTAYAIKTITFTVQSSLPDSAANSTPVTAVKGEQQVLTGSMVADIPLTGPGAPPALPQALATGAANSTATVSLSANDPAASQALSSGNVVSLSSPIVISVRATPGSTANRFVYALVRGDQTIYAADHATDLNLAEIRLQQRSDAQPGLLPGRVVLWVWGVDDHGDYGAPVSAIFDVAPPANSQ